MFKKVSIFAAAATYVIFLLCCGQQAEKAHASSFSFTAKDTVLGSAQGPNGFINCVRVRKSSYSGEPNLSIKTTCFGQEDVQPAYAVISLGPEKASALDRALEQLDISSIAERYQPANGGASMSDESIYTFTFESSSRSRTTLIDTSNPGILPPGLLEIYQIITQL